MILGKHRGSVLNMVVGGVACALIGASFLISAPTSLAQPAADSEYDLRSTMRIQGVLAKFAFLREIEATVLVPAPDEDGEMQEWTVDFGDTKASELRQAGFRLAPGDELTITGNPHLDPERHRILANTITMPDGSSWSR